MLEIQSFVHGLLPPTCSKLFQQNCGKKKTKLLLCPIITVVNWQMWFNSKSSLNGADQWLEINRFTQTCFLGQGRPASSCRNQGSSCTFPCHGTQWRELGGSSPDMSQATPGPGRNHRHQHQFAWMELRKVKLQKKQMKKKKNWKRKSRNLKEDN